MRVFVAVPKFSMITFTHCSVKYSRAHSIFEVEMMSVPCIGEEISAMQGDVMLTVDRIIWEWPEGKNEYCPVLFCNISANKRTFPRD